MRRLSLIVLVFSLLVLLHFQRKDIPYVATSPDIHQGDLLLADNDVLMIEGSYEINGSIIVEENATLILKNALIHFIQKENYEHNMSFMNPLNGNPRLLAENATIEASDYWFDVRFSGNSTGIISKLTTSSDFRLLVYDTCELEMTDVNTYSIYAWDSSVVNMSDSSIVTHAWAVNSSALTIYNSTIGTYLYTDQSANVNLTASSAYYLRISSASVNCSIVGLEPDSISFWSYRLNCSVFVGSGGYAPVVTIERCEIWGWYFDFKGLSNATISNCMLRYLNSENNSTVVLLNCIMTRGLYAYDYSESWLIDSVVDGVFFYIYDEGKVYVNWYLDVHVIDLTDQGIPSANVTAYYSNATVAQSKLTDIDGWTRLTLLEKMINASGEYYVGDYAVEATYSTYSNGTTVNLTESQAITLRLGGFIPEFLFSLVIPTLIAVTLAVIIVQRVKRKTLSRRPL